MAVRDCGQWRPFDPSGPFWNSDGNSGWQFEVLHPANAVALGIDCNRAHMQRRGTYQYNGVPTDLLSDLVVANPDSPTHLLGYAAAGFPIYGPECPGDPTDLKSRTRRLRSSYRLKSGQRKDGPKGRFPSSAMFADLLSGMAAMSFVASVKT